MKRVLINFSDICVVDFYSLAEIFGGYVDGDRHCVVLPFAEELVEELECRGIRFVVEEVV